MKSTTYDYRVCSKCDTDWRRCGISMPVLYGNSWFYIWSGRTIWSSARILALAKRCEGCDMVNIRVYKVLSIFLWKLGVEPHE